MQPDISVIIVTYNSRQDIIKCLQSLQEYCTRATFEILVFDNASSDGSPDLVANTFPAVHLIRHPENIGFARSNNIAAAEARGRYILLLNPDTWVEDDLVADLVGFLDTHPEAAACAPRALRPDGLVQFSSTCMLPTLELLFYEQIGLSQLFPHSSTFGQYRMTCWAHDDVREVEHATAACLAIRREVYLSSGGLDESFFMYIEDVEFSHRLLSLGHKTYYVPSAHVFHTGGSSGSQMPVQSYLEQSRSFYRYFRKYHPRHEVIAAKLIFTVGLLLRIGFNVLAIPITLFAPSRQHWKNQHFWKSRRQQLAGHTRLLLEHWSY